MAERDVIQEFMQKYGRIYEKFLNPEDQQFVMSNLNEEVERLRSHSMAPDQTRDSPLAADHSKSLPDASQGWTEQQKQETVEKASTLVEEQALVERSWVEKFEDRTQSSLWDGRGHTDELMIRSAGQNSNSWSKAVRPEKGPQDFQNALKSMGIERAADREAARDKGIEDSQERGGEGIER